MDFTRAVLLAFLVLPLPLWSAPANVTIRAAADTTLISGEPTNNLGGSSTLIVGTTAQDSTAHMLIRFDLGTNLPAGAVITGVVFNLTVTKASVSGPASTFEVHRLLLPWGEGTGNGSTGSAAKPDAATWRDRFAPDTPWSEPGAAAPGDYSAVVSASAHVDQPAPYAFGFTSNLVADVQTWLDHPDLNFGWLLRSQSEAVPQTARRIASREDPTAPPTLVLSYVVQASPIRISSFLIRGGSALLDWAGGSAPFQIESKSSLSETNWGIVLVTQTNTASFPVAGDQAFFRVGGQSQ
jgi:hypothetical protein